MPQAIFFIATVASSIAPTTFAANLIFAGVVGALSIGATLGLSYLSSLLMPRPSAPAPEDVQQSTRQGVASRYKHYGRVKTSGPWFFAESKQGNFHKVIALSHGEIDAIEEYWVDDVQVTLNGSGVVTTGEPFSALGAAAPRILTRLGTADQDYFSELGSEFSEWTSNHRGRGIAMLYATQFAVSNSQYMDTWSNGINTNYRCVIRGTKVENPLTASVEWSDNPSAIIRDYLTSADGLRLPAAVINTPLALAGWQEAFNDANVSYPLKAGGAEPRYRLWGSYKFDERPADVLFRMLRACDGKLKITNDGGLTLRVGKWLSPSVTIDESAIVAFSDVRRGRDVLTTANTIKATFLDPDQDYQTAEADPWIDASDVSRRGEIANEVAFIMSPSHAQARRLMKVESYRSNPNWVGAFVCNAKGLAAFNEDFININYPPLGINETFELLDFQFNFGKGNILETVVLQVASLSENAYQWDAVFEEGIAPTKTETDVSTEIPVPQNFAVSIGTKAISGSPAAFAAIAFDAPPSLALEVVPEFKLSSESNWSVLSVSPGGNYTETAVLSDGASYDFRARHITSTGRFGDYTATTTVVATADTTAPEPVTNVAATGGSGQVSLSWTMPNSSNVVKAFIRRNTIDNEGTAALLPEPVFGGPNTNLSYEDGGLGPDEYYYWITAANASNVENTSVETGAITVT